MTNCDLSSLESLLASSPEAINAAMPDIALLNLTCATGLPGAQHLDIPQCLAILDKWALAVKCYTQDHSHLYYKDPTYYNCEKGCFCFLSMVTLLKHPTGLQVAYQPTAIEKLDASDSRDDFIHGLLTQKLGTCASMPVLFVAIGRRLNWPMFIAVAKGHVFCQWIDGDRRLNLEGSGPGGGEMFADEYYHSFPHTMTPEDIKSGHYLRPYTPAEELAMFLENRGHCFCDNRRYQEAYEAFQHSHRFAPHLDRLKLQTLRIQLSLDWDRRGIPRDGSQRLSRETAPAEQRKNLFYQQPKMIFTYERQPAEHTFILNCKGAPNVLPSNTRKVDAG